MNPGPKDYVSRERLVGFIEGWAVGTELKEHLCDFSKSQSLLRAGNKGLSILPWNVENFDTPIVLWVRRYITVSDVRHAAVTSEELYAAYLKSTDDKLSSLSFARKFSYPLQEAYPDEFRRGEFKPSKHITYSSKSGNLIGQKRGWLGISYSSLP